MQTYYTVADVARMTGLTERTIRSYLRDGKLLGSRVGVQWRFTEAQVTALFADAQAQQRIAQTKAQHVLDFLQEAGHTSPSACTVVDVPCPQDARLACVVRQLTDDMSASNGKMDFFFQYLEACRVARFILIAPLDVTASMMREIQTLLKEENDATPV